MGTINYKTSKYITLSIQPYDFEDIKKGIIDNIEEYDGLTPDDIDDDFVYDEITNYYDADSCNARVCIEEYDLEYFSVTIEPGYYEGLSIMIEDNLPYYDYTDEVKDIKNDIDKLHDLLVNLAGCGFVETWPGWCTSYKNYDDTITGIENAINEIKNDLDKNIKNFQEENANDFIEAITAIVNNQDCLDNLHSYLSQHFNVWIKKYANSVSGLCDEMQHFSRL